MKVPPNTGAWEGVDKTILLGRFGVIVVCVKGEKALFAVLRVLQWPRRAWCKGRAPAGDNWGHLRARPDFSPWCKIGETCGRKGVGRAGNACERKTCDMTPEYKGPEKEAEKGIKERRGDVSDAERDDLAPEAILARPGGPGDRPDGPCGPRGARVLAAVVGFLKGRKTGRKRVRHSTGIARAGGERPLAHQNKGFWA